MYSLQLYITTCHARDGVSDTPEHSNDIYQRTEVQSYDEMKRRGTRKRKVTYLVTDGQRAGAKRDSMAAGAATLDRTVGQRYEWRDGGLAEAKRRRGGLFGGARDGA